ncbi:hypothetical protein [Oceanidesulfovibrio marinus]|uniref:Uncharacterized protein n=1 Tax=Oceanidesulfovibrio marinus TaxID=370038 RepID=A0ABX6NI07_9BACT|nr:hypothetical protein [Oceanidesulfovibrio marinus]QJT10219.1 hypothetical protein E8L03_15345 [Oceanidesulfovibrio marinus]
MPTSIPSTFYMFCQRNHLMVNNLQYTGGITSNGIATATVSPEATASYLSGDMPYIGFGPIHGRENIIPSYFHLSVLSEYYVEYALEYVRSGHFKTYPSRVTCFFAFDDMDFCHKASAIYGWNLNEVKIFNLVPSPLNKYARCDMEIVTIMRAFQPYGTPFELFETAAHRYWSGQSGFGDIFHRFQVNEPPPEREPIWETLIEGRLQLVNGDQPAC